MSVIWLLGGGGLCRRLKNIGTQAASRFPRVDWTEVWHLFLLLLLLLLFIFRVPKFEAQPRAVNTVGPTSRSFQYQLHCSLALLDVFSALETQPSSSSPDGASSLRRPGVQNADCFLWYSLLSYLLLGISPVLQTHQNLGCPVFTALQAETVLVIIELNWTHLAVVSVWCGTHGKRGLSGEALA